MSRRHKNPTISFNIHRALFTMLGIMLFSGFAVALGRMFSSGTTRVGKIDRSGGLVDEKLLTYSVLDGEFSEVMQNYVISSREPEMPKKVLTKVSKQAADFRGQYDRVYNMVMGWNIEVDHTLQSKGMGYLTAVVKEIKREIVSSVNPELLLRLFSNKVPLKVRLYPYTLNSSPEKETTFGVYKADEHVVYLFIMDPAQKQNSRHFASAVANEFHHAVVAHARGVKTSGVPIPFKDSEQEAALVRALDRGIERFMHIATAVSKDKAGAALTKQESAVVSQLRKLVKSYVPNITAIMQHENMMTPDGRIKMMAVAKRGSGRALSFDDKTVNIPAIKRLPSGVFRGFFTHSGDKLAVFIEDMFTVFSRYDGQGEQSDYTILGFASGDDSPRIAQLMSDLEHLPPALQQFIFSEVCDYMSEFTNVKDYCYSFPFPKS